jgi:predicted nuclease of predicted toxin-antitoxin system
MRFLLDENVHQGLVPFLTGLGHETARSPKGVSNGAVFAAAASAQRILLTHDKDFAEWHPTEHHPGVVLLRIVPGAFDQLQTALQRVLLD